MRRGDIFDAAAGVVSVAGVVSAAVEPVRGAEGIAVENVAALVAENSEW